MSSHPIETHDLGRRFRGLTAVRDLTLEVRRGEVFALLGPNGAGKSTTVKMLMSLLPPSAGRASLLGTESSRLGPAVLARVGYVAEDQQIPGWMTLEQLAAYLRPLYATWDDELCRRLSGTLDVPSDRKVRHLSRGERMKAAILLALAFRPEVLVMDEPFSGLDPVNREDLVDGFLEMVAGETVTVLVCSHDLATVGRLADRVGFLQRGGLILDEGLDSLQQRFREVEVVVEGQAALPDEMPGSWLRPRVSGPTARFVDTEFAGAEGAAEIRARFERVRDLQARPMDLREIFIAVSRSHREGRRREVA